MGKPKWTVPAALLLGVLLLTQCAFQMQASAAPPAEAAPMGVQALAPDPAVRLELPCRAAILMDQNTGDILYEKNSEVRMPVASITKVMTLLLTFEAIHDGKLDYEQEVPVSAHAAAMGGSQIWLEPGEHFTLHEMLKAICVSSANDAAVAVAELVAGSESAFVSRMNARAAQLGMNSTHYENACGLDREGHLSTAKDVAILSRYILNTCPEVQRYTKIWTDTLRGGRTHLVNTNKLIRRYEGMTGLKTGTTGGAGVCLSATATREGLSLVGVVLGSDSGAQRFEAARTLLDYGFANYEAGTVPLPPNAPLTLPVRGAAQSTLPLDYTAIPRQVLLHKGQAAGLNAALTLPENISAPLAAGQPVGAVKLYAGETEIGSWPVKSALQVEKMDFGAAFRLVLRRAMGAETD